MLVPRRAIERGAADAVLVPRRAIERAADAVLVPRRAIERSGVGQLAIRPVGVLNPVRPNQHPALVVGRRSLAERPADHRAVTRIFCGRIVRR